MHRGQDPALTAADVTGGLLAVHRPVTVNEAARILATQYGIDGVLKRFTSERDDTFRVDSAEGRFVLKVAHPLERPDEVSLQIDLLDAIAQKDPSLPVPRVVRDLTGRTYHRFEDSEGRIRLVRLLSCLSGHALKDTSTDSLERFAVGRALGRLRLACAGFSHPAESRVLAWDVQHVEALRPLLVHQSGAHRDLLVGALQRLAFLKPKIDSLPRQVLHNDFNKPNILVNRDAPEFVTGIVDFGDTVRTAVAIDVATAAQDHLPDDAGAYQQGAIFDDAADVVRGYLDVADLAPTELRLVPHLMMARTVAVGLITTVRAELMPDNASYILRTTGLVWPQLRWFLDRNTCEVSDEFVARVQREATGV